MSNHQRTLTHPDIEGLFVCPPCSVATEQAYADMGWVPVSEAGSRGPKRDALVALAGEHGVAVDPKATKADIAAAIDAAEPSEEISS